MANMGTPLGQMIIELGLDSSKFGKGLQSAKNEVRMWEQATRASMNAAVASGNRLDGLKSKYDGLTNAMKAQQKVVDQLKDDYAKSFDKNGEATKRTERLAGQLAQAEAKLQGYRGQINQTAADMARLQVETQGFTGWLNKSGNNLIKNGERLKTFGSGLSSIGNSMTVGVTAPIMAGTIAVTKAAIDWESAFTGVKKTVNEIVDANGNVTYSYAELEGKLKNLATRLPATHQEIAQVAENAGQLGISTDHIVEFTKTMIDMGESTNLSADEASTALARLANITGMSQDKFSNLGSSIVWLGNNFATTEQEITEMSLRLAGAGKQIGLSQGSITGIAAALSSVGIEAEQGGSAFSKLMVSLQLAVEKGAGAMQPLQDLADRAGVSIETMNRAVNAGGKELKAIAANAGLTSAEFKDIWQNATDAAGSLSSFAQVAGMSSDEFAKLFKSKPEVALERFVKGLGESEKHGKSAIAVLDEMGITEVRLRDTLLRAANAGDLMTKAIEGGNKAFNENTALANEANKRYETTESKLKMLRNEAVNLGIELGGPLVDALRDGLQAAKPWLETLSDMAEKFSQLEPEQQRSILKWIAMGAAAGPTLKILGGGISTVGGLYKAFGTLSKGLVDLAAKASEKQALSGLTTSITALGTEATVASGVGGAATAGITGLGGAIAGMAGPIAIGVGALTLLAGTVALGMTAYEHHQLAVGKWGVSVTKDQDKVATKAQEMQQTANDAIERYQSGLTKSSDEIVKANENIVSSIQKVIDKKKEQLKNDLQNIENEEARKAAEAEQERQLQQAEQLKQNAQASSDAINAIIKQASQNNRKLSNEENQYLRQQFQALNADLLKAQGMSAKQIERITETMNKNISEMSMSERARRAEDVQAGLNDINKWYDNQKKYYSEFLKTNPEEYKKYMSQLNTEYKARTADMIKAAAELAVANGQSIDDLKATWESYGYTVDEVKKLVSETADKNTSSMDMMAQGANKAAAMWNAMVFDPKTGEIKTNMADTILEMAKTDEGWNNLTLIAKTANISTNAKEEIAIAAGEAGRWNSLSVEEKALLVNGDGAKMSLYNAIDQLGYWNQYNADRKTLGIDNADAVYRTLDTIEKLQAWNYLKPEQKKMLVDASNAKENIQETSKKWDWWEKLPNSIKNILVNANYSQVTAAKMAIDNIADYSLKEIEVRTKYTQDGTPYVQTTHGGRQYAQGTNYHLGGPAIVNDQPGPTYKELVIPKDGLPFIPEGRDVFLPNLPRGSKVLTASQTKRLFPHYAEGVGIPKNARIFNLLNETNNTTTNTVSTADYSSLLVDILQSIDDLSNAMSKVQIYMDKTQVGNLLANPIATRQARNALIERKIGGASY